MAKRDPWWLGGGTETCHACTHLYACETGFYCAACDRGLCVHCVVIERSTREYVPPLLIADFYSALRDAGGTLQWLERAWEAHSGFLPRVAFEPNYDWLHDDPRFVEMMQRFGFDEAWRGGTALRLRTPVPEPPDPRPAAG